MARLVVCESCRRHVHETEARCPFCDGEVRARPVGAIPTGISRAAQYALGAAVITSAAVSASCGDEGPVSKSPSDSATGAAPTSTATANATATSLATAAATATATATVTSQTNVVATGTPTATATGTAAVTATAKAGGAFACGGQTCTPAQYCLHPCSPCGGQTARMGKCPPQPAPACASTLPAQAQVQGREAYAYCPPMPYGCVFPDGCASVSV